MPAKTTDNLLFVFHLKMISSKTSFLFYLICFISKSFGETIRYRFEIAYMSGSPDGVTVNHILGINGQFPGPTIEATLNDIVEVEVVNGIQDGQNVTLHWHGLRQTGTPFEDGPSMVTQCPIKQGSSQIYSFVVDLPGTYWYHSHVNSQYTEGLWGLLIVHNPQEPYQYDDEIRITLSDWYHTSALVNEEWYLSSRSVANPPFPSSVLMNSFGRYSCDFASRLNPPLPCYTAAQQRPVLKILPGKIYRVRLLNIAARTPINFTIDGYKLLPIEVDGIDVSPANVQAVDAVYIGVAQRYSFILQPQGGSPTPGRHLIRAYPRRELMFNNASVPNINPFPEAFGGPATGVLEYVNELPNEELVQVETERFDYTQTVPNMPRSMEALEFLDELTLLPNDWISAPSNVDQEFTFQVALIQTPDGILHITFNGTPYQPPQDKPLLMKVLDGDPLPETLNVHYLNYNSVVQVVVNNPGSTPHPFHLHGHHFWVVGKGNTGDGNYNPNVHRLNTRALKRDTVMANGRSYLVIRFIADNPGVWTFHCHIDWHNLSGMIVNFIEAPAEAKATLFYTPQIRETCQQQNINIENPKNINISLFY